LTIRSLIGCAGWSVPSTVSEYFPETGSHLERYAAVLPAVEINTSFYRPHKPETYARWRDSVPDNFRFSVKMPRTITHDARLRDIEPLLMRFLAEVAQLQEKLGCLLVQLPPTLAFDPAVATAFFTLLRAATAVPIACEPRHASWFGAAAVELLGRFRVARVVADPPAVQHATEAIDVDIAYVRLHGSPVIYHSRYENDYLDTVVQALARHVHSGRQAWCIMDNTATGAAMPNALSLLKATRSILSNP
jgi:uncharacterized protein YecE (DUF72 family)